MPNGGLVVRGKCARFDPDAKQCTLREVRINDPFWMECDNWSEKGFPAEALDITGPIRKIVVQDGKAYVHVPIEDD